MGSTKPFRFYTKTVIFATEENKVDFWIQTFVYGGFIHTLLYHFMFSTAILWEYMSAKALKNILIVEDEKPLARALELKLGKEGFKTKIVGNGEEAIAELKNNTYTLMILDLVMPRLDGFHVLQYVEDEKVKVKVLVLSNLSQSEDIKKAKEYGAVDYFVKSNTPIVSLVAEVKKALS
jgi:CheY-like chemotaxis protein